MLINLFLMVLVGSLGIDLYVFWLSKVLALPHQPEQLPNNREGGHNLARNIKESIYIRVNNPTLNNNIGKFNLPHIWDRVLLNIKSLYLKRQVNNNNTQPN